MNTFAASSALLEFFASCWYCSVVSVTFAGICTVIWRMYVCSGYLSSLFISTRP